MVESLMLVALGFLTATFFAAIAIQLAWRRAVKVTTQRIEAELGAGEMRQASERLAGVEIQLQDKLHEARTLGEQNAQLSERNAQLEEALSRAHRDAQSLHDEIGTLHASNDAARAEAEAHARNVSALQSRIAALEAAASAEIARQGTVATQLKSLGEKAARLIFEMNEVFGHAATPADLEAAMATPAAPAPQEPETTPALTPYPDDEAADGDDRQLAEIKASLSKFSEATSGDFVSDTSATESETTTEENDEKPLPTEGFLAERIRALEAGVTS